MTMVKVYKICNQYLHALQIQNLRLKALVKTEIWGN